ncbi:MAG: hypothetical protein H6739_15120 [Alphaproteobacteria bacterium]|nr:hypothetical protein [Alphaproteobacteria bacterium]
MTHSSSSDAERHLGALTADGALRLVVQLSRPRSSSNAIARLAGTGADITTRSYALELDDRDSPQLFERLRADIDEHELSEDEPLIVYAKEHAAALNPDQLERLRPLVHAWVLVVRDPLLTCASLLRLQSLSVDTSQGRHASSLHRAVAHALIGPRGHDLARRYGLAPVERLHPAGTFPSIRPELVPVADALLDRHAAERGHTDWATLEAHIDAHQDFTPLDGLWEAVYPVVPEAWCTGPRERMTNDPLGFLGACWRRMKALLAQDPERVVVVDATTLQAGAGVSTLAARAGLRSLQKTGWSDARASRTMGIRSKAGEVWYGEALASTTFRAPSRPTVPLSQLSAAARAVVRANLPDWIDFLFHPCSVGPTSPEQALAMLAVPASVGTVETHNPLWSYVVAPSERARMRAQWPEHADIFDDVDQIMPTWRNQATAAATPSRTAPGA